MSHLRALLFSSLSGLAVCSTALPATAAETTPAPAANPADTGSGQYLSLASDCAACHSAPGNKPFAGGLPIVTPVGTMYTTNITPSKTDGIGQYSEKQFSDAVRLGIRSDGTHLYPAMPYTSYALLTDQDIHALYTYFMRQVAPVDITPPKTDLSFPYNQRWAIAAWNMLYANDKSFVPDASQSDEWNRGKYLVEGPAHCSVCHTSRGFMMQEKASNRFDGASLGTWFAPNISSDPVSGIGHWSVDELAQYLKTGKLHGKAQAAGDMATAVEDSFSHMSDADLKAMAVYMKSVKAVHNTSDTASRFDLGHTPADGAIISAPGTVTSDNNQGDGAQMFNANCAACHGVDGQGTRDGYYPSLFHNSTLSIDKGHNFIATVLFGVSRTTAQGQAFMPGFGGKPTDIAALSDDQVAKIANYAMQTFGDPKIVVTVAQVSDIRNGKGPTPPLVGVVDIAKWLAIPVLLVLGVLLYRWRGKRRQRAQKA